MATCFGPHLGHLQASMLHSVNYTCIKYWLEYDNCRSKIYCKGIIINKQLCQWK